MASKININNLGPIESAELHLKPLTILVGPNNTGKSHAALLVYALAQALRHTPMWGSLPRLRRLAVPVSRYYRGTQLSNAKRRQLSNAFKHLSSRPVNSTETHIAMQELPTSLQQTILEMSQSSFQLACRNIEQELKRCFGSTLQNIIRKTANDFQNDMTIGLMDDSLGLVWSLRNAQDTLSIDEIHVDSSKIGFDESLFRVPQQILQDDLVFVLQTITEQYVSRVFQRYSAHSHYLPATRSGILQGHKTLSSLIVGKASRAWLEPLEVPRLPGVTTDLIQALFLLGHQELIDDSNIQRIVSFLESEVTKGSIGIDSQYEYPDIYYENTLGRFELHNISSMISEMAPLVLFLKFLVQREQLLIFEEPESHLDPRNQANVARAIAMMVNAGIRVIVTTHSDIFLNQINNLAQIGNVSPRKRRAMGYKVNEMLRSEDIGAYAFRPGEDGTIVTPAAMHPNGGFSIEASEEIHRLLYEEAVVLEHSTLG